MDFSSILDTIISTLTNMGLPMEEIMTTLDPIISSVSSLFESLFGGLLG